MVSTRAAETVIAGPAREGSPQRRPLVVWLVPYVAALFMPALLMVVENWPHAVRPKIFWIMVAGSAVPSIALVAWLSRGFRQRLRWSLAVGMISTIVLFQWPAFTFDAESGLLGNPIVDAVLPVTLAGTLLWLVVRRGDELLFASIAGCGVMAAVIGMLVVSFPLMTSGPAPPGPGTPGAAAPDVLLVVLDGYARADWFTEFGLDQGTLMEDLQERGFAAAPLATANFNHTLGSIGSMLNLDYIIDEGPISEDERELMRSSLMGSTGIFTAFRRAGYQTEYFVNDWGGSQCGPAIDRCVSSGQLGLATWALGQMTIFAPLLDAIAPRPFNEQSIDQLEEVGDLLSEGNVSSRPRFTYAHFIAPHPPHLLAADCSRPHGAELRPRRQGFADQTRCVNRLVLDGIDRVLAEDPNTLIMITADHGPGLVGDMREPADAHPTAVIQRRMQIFSAYRLGDCAAEVPVDLTPTNGARLLVNCALGTDLPPLPDRHLWISTDLRGDAVDVTSRLDP